MNNQAELISIGNELLSGRTLNTHGKDLGEALAAIGLRLIRDTTIPDDIPTIGTAVQEALNRTDIVFVSGGLGPTIDDITRDALAELLHCSIVPHQPTIDHLSDWYEQRGRTITPAGARQALVLEGAVVLFNSIGAAPGQRIELPGHKTLFVLPGPPNEFNVILAEEIIPWLTEQFPDAVPQFVRVLRTRGIGESDMVTLLEKAGFQPEEVDLGFYPDKGRVEIRLTAESDQQQKVIEAENTLLLLLHDFIDT